MTYAQIQAQERRELKLFRFAAESENQEACIVTASTRVIMDGKFCNWMPGAEFFFVYPYLRSRYEIF